MAHLVTAIPGSRYARLGRGLCIGGAALGVLGLIGWIAGKELLTAILPGQPSMKPNTALALLLIGGAGALRHQAGGAGRWRRALSASAALAVLAIGAATLAEYALGLDLHVDRLLVRGQAGAYPGRPSPPAALALALLAAAVLLSGGRATARARVLEWLVLAAGLTAFTSLTGIAFGAGQLYRLTHAPLTGVSFPTAISLLLTSAGLLLQNPATGVARAVTSPGPGGVLLRRLAIPAIAAPMFLGFVLIRSEAALGLEQLSLLTAIVSSGLTVVSLVLLTITAVHLNRTNEALESSRQWLRTLVEQAPDGIFVADITGRYTDVNLAGCRILGSTREEIVGKTIVDLIPPEDVDRLSQSKDRMLGGAADVGEWRLRRADGSYVPVEVSASILPDGRWQGFVRDISERKHVEEKLREAQERIALALRGADLATWDWNVQSGEVIFSARWAEMRGFRLEEVRPHVDSWTSGIHPDDWPRVQRALDDYFQGRAPEYEAEFRSRTRSGEWIWILDRGKVFARDERGRPARMVGTEHDVTARRRAAEEVRLAEARSSGILSISADAIISIGEDQRITLFNDGAEQIFGYSREEVIGAPLDVLIPQRLAAVHRRHVETFAAGESAARRMGERGMAIAGRRKSGEEFPAEAAISKLEVAGKKIFTVALRDVTEQRRRDGELRRAIRSRDELMGVVAHDLRNPLGSIV
ncbi:MAG TPA: PAS domain S-box protein, partial [Myxococcaceae bacterium]